MNTIIIDGLSFALPLFIMAIGGISCERSGVTNLAIEGLQGFGAFCGALFAVCIAPYFAGDSPVPFYLAMVFAFLGGTLFSLLHAMLCIRFKANQVISGVVINILAMSLTEFMTKQINASIFKAASNKFVLGVSARVTVPGISSVPVLGAVFTNLYPFEPVIALIAVIAWYVLYRKGASDCGSGFRGFVGTWRHLLCLLHFREFLIQYLFGVRVSGHCGADFWQLEDSAYAGGMPVVWLCEIGRV